MTGLCAQVASKLSPEDKAAVERAVEDAIAWLDANQLAEVDELEHKCALPRSHMCLNLKSKVPWTLGFGTLKPEEKRHRSQLKLLIPPRAGLSCK